MKKRKKSHLFSCPTCGNEYDTKSNPEMCQRLAFEDRILLAAPDMLKVLKQHFERMERRYIQAELEGNPIPASCRDPIYDRTKAAIAKAEGKKGPQ